MPKTRDDQQAFTSPAQVEKYLKGIDFPATLEDMIEHARENGAPEDVISLLEQMPDREYDSAADVAKGVGEIE